MAKDTIIDACEWIYDELDDKWDTSCDHSFQFFSGAPIENEFQFCPYCGKVLIDKEIEP